MAESNIIGKTLCPWCNSELEVVKSPKSGFHYANCPSCNGHFRNVPVAIIDMNMKGKEKPPAKPYTGESALERLRREVEIRQQSQPELESGESALERLRREVGLSSNSDRRNLI